jgi:LCP family protein required for cell wall assembly
MVHVPADRSRAYLVSLPRDGEVTLPGGARGKLNETLRIGGPALTEKTVTGLTGVEFDATVTIDFRALRAVTEAVGGVEMCLPQAFTSMHNGRKYPQGCQHLGAADVTPVLQARYGLENGSYDRDRNAQRFLRALFAKVAADGTLRSPIRMNELLVAGRDGIEIDGELATLLRTIPRASTEVVGVSEPGFHSMGNGRERIYPSVGPGLYAAIRDDDLAAWTAANPTFLLK